MSVASHSHQRDRTYDLNYNAIAAINRLLHRLEPSSEDLWREAIAQPGDFYGVGSPPILWAPLKG